MRDDILTILLDNCGNFVSGETISDRLNVTRAAVWKHIKTLQKEGFVIESVSRKGYRLVATPNRLEEVTLLYGMKTNMMGRTIEIHQSIDSTSNRVRELALSGYPDGTLVISEEQIKGRGRMGREWISPSGEGIWMSLLLRPNIPPKEAPGITAMAAVAVKNALAELTGLSVGIKWPNDIIVNNRKVCGILTEIHADLDIIHYVIIGMGINANIERGNFPREIADSATSLLIESGDRINRMRVIQKIMQEMETLYNNYMQDQDLIPILDECRRCSVTLGQRVRVLGRDDEFEGQAVDLADDGALLVLRDDGKTEKIFSGDVSVRGIEGYV